MRSRGVWGSENETGQDKIRGMPSQSSAEERKDALNILAEKSIYTIIN